MYVIVERSRWRHRQPSVQCRRRVLLLRRPGRDQPGGLLQTGRGQPDPGKGRGEGGEILTLILILILTFLITVFANAMPSLTHSPTHPLTTDPIINGRLCRSLTTHLLINGRLCLTSAHSVGPTTRLCRIVSISSTACSPPAASSNALGPGKGKGVGTGLGLGLELGIESTTGYQ